MRGERVPTIGFSPPPPRVSHDLPLRSWMSEPFEKSRMLACTRDFLANVRFMRQPSICKKKKKKTKQIDESILT